MDIEFRCCIADISSCLLLPLVAEDAAYAPESLAATCIDCRYEDSYIQAIYLIATLFGYIILR